jgi:hypothetical protein
MSLLYVIMQNIQVSSAQKRYRNSLEAAHGGARLSTDVFIPALFDNFSGNRPLLIDKFQANALQIPVSGDCFKQKLNSPTSDWSACSNDSKSADPKTAPDMTFTLRGLQGQPGFNVSSKVVDTQVGNTDTSGDNGLLAGAGVTGANSGVSPKHIPSLYTIEVEAERQQNPREKAALSVLYAY